MLYCLLAFILGWLAARIMGNGFSVGGEDVITEGQNRNILLDCMRSNLRYLSNKKLQGLAGTNSHYSKTIIINMIVDEMNGNT